MPAPTDGGTFYPVSALAREAPGGVCATSPGRRAPRRPTYRAVVLRFPPVASTDSSSPPRCRTANLTCRGRSRDVEPRNAGMRPRSGAALGSALFPAAVLFTSTIRGLDLLPELLVTNSGPFVDASVGCVKEGA